MKNEEECASCTGQICSYDAVGKNHTCGCYVNYELQDGKCVGMYIVQHEDGFAVYTVIL